MARYILVKERTDWVGFLMLVGFALFMKALPVILLACAAVVFLWLLFSYPRFMGPLVFCTVMGLATIWIGTKSPILGVAIGLYLVYRLIRRVILSVATASRAKRLHLQP